MLPPGGRRPAGGPEGCSQRSGHIPGRAPRVVNRTMPWPAARATACGHTSRDPPQAAEAVGRLTETQARSLTDRRSESESRSGRSNISAANDRPGSQGGSQHRQAPGYVRPQRTSPFAGERHAGQRPATSGDGPGLIHTEEVTGSIPVSPTDISPVHSLHGQLSSHLRDGSCRRIGRNLGDHLLRPPSG